MHNVSAMYQCNMYLQALVLRCVGDCSQRNLCCIVYKQGIPQQMNGSDCGMFACKFAEYITRGAQITFSQVSELFLLTLRFFVKMCLSIQDRQQLKG